MYLTNLWLPHVIMIEWLYTPGANINLVSNIFNEVFCFYNWFDIFFGVVFSKGGTLAMLWGVAVGE